MGTVKAYLYSALFAVLAFCGVLLYRKGGSDEQAKLSQDNLNAMRTAKDIRDEIDNDPYFVDRATRWVRKDDR